MRYEQVVHCSASIIHLSMIGFGELRKKSVTWQTDLSAVEKVYALDWLLKGIVDRAALRENLTLRGASALAHAYFVEYPRVPDLEMGRAPDLPDAVVEQEIGAALEQAARASGLRFKLHSFHTTEARVEFTGPLGRRSAAQPLLVARFVSSPARVEPEWRSVLHPFDEEYAAQAQSIALTELAAERIVLYAQKPRARDVFDLWFILTRGAAALDRDQTRALAQRIADEKRVVLHPNLDDTYAPFLDRAWENALKSIRPHPTWTRARAEIDAYLKA